MISQGQDERYTDLKAAAVRQQHNILMKRMRLFGRAALWQVCALLFIGVVIYLIPGEEYSTRAVGRFLLGQPLMNGLWGLILLLFYVGIRRHNLWCGMGAVLTCIAAMLSSPLMGTMYGPSGEYTVRSLFGTLALVIFLLLYVLPFSIMVFQLPSFSRWKKLKERYQGEYSDREEELFGAENWKPGPAMLFWVILLLAGTGICLKDQMDYKMAWDMTSWECFTVPGTQVSVELPAGKRMESQADDRYMVYAGGEYFQVQVFCMEATEAESGEEDIRDGIDIKTLAEPRDGTMGEVNYRQTAERQQQSGFAMDIYSRSFEVEGKAFVCAVMVFGRTDKSMEQRIEKIFDTIHFGEEQLQT